jgi:hypothetical protein
VRLHMLRQEALEILVDQCRRNAALSVATGVQSFSVETYDERWRPELAEAVEWRR